MGKVLMYRKGQTRRYSPSRIFKYEDCPWQMYLHYVAGIRKAAISSNLIFGKIVHEAISMYLAGLYAGMNFDPEAHFAFKWDEETKKGEIEYSNPFDQKSLGETGKKLCSMFPEYWEKAGLFPLIDDEGPVIERKLEVDIGGGIIVLGIIDVVAMNADGEVVVLDFKTPKAASKEEIYYVSDQLTCYQLLVDAFKDQFGIEKVDKVGFMELLKKKIPEKPNSKSTGPEIMLPATVPARSDQEVQDFLQKVRWYDSDIQEGRFPKRGKMAHNSPCGLCDLKDYCLKGETEGLTFPAEFKLAEGV